MSRFRKGLVAAGIIGILAAAPVVAGTCTNFAASRTYEYKTIEYSYEGEQKTLLVSTGGVKPEIVVLGNLRDKRTEKIGGHTSTYYDFDSVPRDHPDVKAAIENLGYNYDAHKLGRNIGFSYCR